MVMFGHAIASSYPDISDSKSVDSEFESTIDYENDVIFHIAVMLNTRVVWLLRKEKHNRL